MNYRKQFETSVFVSLKTIHGLQLINRKREIRGQTMAIIHDLLLKFSDDEVDSIIKDMEKKEVEVEKLIVETLVALSVQENVMAFQLIMERYTGTIMNEINKYLGTGSSYSDFEKVHEKSMEIWDKVQRHIDKFDSKKAGFFTWVKTIAENTMKNSPKKMDSLTDYFSEQSDDADDNRDQFDSKQRQMRTDQTQFSAPDVCFQRAYKSKMIFQTVFKRESGYPWQLICFGLIAIGEKPGNIAKKYADCILSELTQLLKSEIEMTSVRDEEDIKDIFSELDEDLEKTLDDIILSTDMRTRKNIKTDLKQIAEMSLLEAFFGSKPASNIGDWKRRTAKRIRAIIEKEGIPV